MAATAIQSIVVKANDQENDVWVARVRDMLDTHGVFAMSFQGAGGCGKTSLVEASIKTLRQDRRCALIAGSSDTTCDTQRIAALDVPVVHVSTGGGCHLSANMMLESVQLLDLGGTDILLIENIGNLHCAAKYRLGEHSRVACLSAAGGLQVVEKYPLMFSTSDLNLITKSDLAEHVHFDIPKAVSRLRQINPGAKVLVTDAFGGDGVDTLCRCIQRGLDGAGCRD